MIDFCSAYFILGTLERYENRHETAEASFLEAQSLWYKGDQIKLHRFNAACIYKTGVVLIRGRWGRLCMRLLFFSHSTSNLSIISTSQKAYP